MAHPTEEWLNKYEKSKALLKPTTNLNDYFIKNEISGKKIHILDIGTVRFPTGSVIVADPLVYLNRKSEPYFNEVPTGVFPIKAAVVEVDEDHYRYAAVKVSFNDKTAGYYIEALTGRENLDEAEAGCFFGFNVDAGLAAVVDLKTRDAYCDFIDNWIKDNPDGNTYDDLFAYEFRRSYEKNPKFQRDGGDWINFTIPDTDLNIPMFQTGFGDGAYPVYFGYDENDEICQIVIEFIDIELTFSEKE
jgi:hypothetical protein